MIKISLILVAAFVATPASAKPYHSPVGVWVTTDYGSCDEPNAYVSYRHVRTPAYFTGRVTSIPMRKNGDYEIHIQGEDYILMADVTATTARMITPWNGMHEYQLRRC